jgi:tungstate transport system ATP-binding protein
MNQSTSDSTPVLTARDIKVVYGEHVILNIPEFSVPSDKVMSIIGPNGSGKTTLLLCLSLLQKPTSGEILYRGRVVHNGSALRQTRRQFAVAFQEPLLLNTSVWNNVTMGLRLRGVKGPEAEKRAWYWLERFGIASKAKQHAHTLSGGEAQRANLARAFVLQPEVLFLDEPFAAVDTPTRQALFGDMMNILRETSFATVMVTHDRNEAQALSHQVAVIMNGQIAQVGTPREIFSSPASEEIAKFIGMENVLEGVVASNNNCIADINVGGHFVVGVSSCQAGGAVNIFIRPEDITISLSEPAGSARNVFPGRITSMVPTGPLVRVGLDCGFPLVALITRMSSDELGLDIGKNVYASFKSTAIHVNTIN